MLKPTTCFIIAILYFANTTPLPSNILEVTHQHLVAKDSGCSSRIVLLDISKAFDKVIHSALFKLRQLGVTGSVYNLLQTYLSGRSQFVRLGDFRSDHLYTNCGVPQGGPEGSNHFVRGEAASQTKYCRSPKIKHFEPPQKVWACYATGPPSQPHTFAARLLFDETFVEPNVFAVVDCSAVALSVFYSIVFMRSPTFLQL